MTNWTHKVVKTQRGAQGQWFRYRAAMTGTETEAREYAQRFAAYQRDDAESNPVIARREGAE